MKLANQSKLRQAVLVGVCAAFLATTAVAQDYPPPPNFSPGQLDDLVSRIALYPDPLLAQIFAAASFPDQIPDAARWAGQYRNLRGNELADAMSQANLQFDPAVQALIPFPTVLDMMASDSGWTSQLGNAVLADRSGVMDAVQRMRRSAEQYGYLQSNQQVRVDDSGGEIEIEPVDPSLMYVPAYDPYVVYAPPRPGFFVGGAIRFGSFYSIGAFSGWGWGGGFNWRNHALIVNHVPWGRSWYNRNAYVHNYGNWDRGAWRNSYVNRNDRFRNDGPRYNRPVPVAPNRNYDRGNGNQYRNGNQYGNSYRNQGSPNVAPPVNRQFVPATPSRNFERHMETRPGGQGERRGNGGGNGGENGGRGRGR